MSVVTNTTTIGAIEAPSRRNTELALLAFAVVIPVFAYVNVGLAINGELPAGMLGYGLGLGLLAGVAHLVVRKFATYADPLLLPLATLLNGLGLVLIWRLDQSRAADPARRAALRRLQPRRPQAADVLRDRHRPLRRRTDPPQGPPHPAALHLHLDGGRAGPADPAGVLPGGERRQDLDQPRPASPSSPASSRRSSSRSSSPAT